VAAATLGVVLLLWHEITTLSGRPLGVAMMLVAAATWAIGTQQMRRTRIAAPTLAISFWMTLATTLWMSLLAVVFERDQWMAPNPAQWAAIAYNALGVFAFAQVAWLVLARELPPIASTLSVMFIPVLGVFSGAWWLGEVLHWQDWAAVALVMLSIATVLWPPRSAAARVAAPRGG
jgi:drug/metabolite transporter (DMT)-like permease